MTRDGPGFLVDLLFLWLVVMACLVVADWFDRQFGRPVGLLLGIAAAVVIVFSFLVAYYRMYLDERPLLGTVSRTRFVILAFQFILVGFVLGALLTPPDPTTQVAVASAVVLIGLVFSYWWIYRRRELPVAGAE